MGRPPCCDKANVKKGPWTAEEDAKILAYVASHGIGNWTLVPQKAGLNRCGKSCRLRWTNYLRPDLKHDNFTPQEEDLILEFHRAVGSRWSLIAKNLPGRTDNDVKNHWNTKLKKKLTKMGIDPITHKPFRQLLSDYGNISDLPNARNRAPPFLNHNNNNFTPNTTIPNTQGFSVPTHETIRVNNANNQAWENLPYFQATNGQEMASYSSTSSPCSPSLTHMNLPSSPSAWSEYLASDASLFPNKDQGQYCDFQGILEEPAECEGVKGENGNEACRAYSSHDVFIDSTTNNFFDNASSSSSFVEAMLNRDREMQLEFPQLLDGLNID